MKRAAAALRKRQVILDTATDSVLNELVESLRAATGTRLTTSHAVRALLTAFAPAMNGIADLRAPSDARVLPNNAPRYASERARFERSLADLIVIALRHVA